MPEPVDRQLATSRGVNRATCSRPLSTDRRERREEPLRRCTVSGWPPEHRSRTRSRLRSPWPLRSTPASRTGGSAGDLEVPDPRRAPTCRAAVDLRARCAAFALALPADSAFSHLTAARLLDLPTPLPWPGPEELLDVMRDRSRNPVIRSGCRGHRGLESRSVLVRGGLRVTSPADTWCDLAGSWSRPALLAAADVLLRRSHIDCARARRSRRGAAGRRHARGPLCRRPAGPRRLRLPGREPGALHLLRVGPARAGAQRERDRRPRPVARHERLPLAPCSRRR